MNGEISFTLVESIETTDALELSKGRQLTVSTTIGGAFEFVDASVTAEAAALSRWSKSLRRVSVASLNLVTSAI
jgi:hypothetical protein